MTRFPHDEFAKGFLESLLSPFGQVQTSFKISSEVREVDVYFQANSATKSASELGLLGKLAKTDLVIEPFRNSPTTFQIRACLGKLFDLHAEMIREAKRNNQPVPKDDNLPMLWILAPTLSESILMSYCAQLVVDFAPTGVYMMPPGLKTGIVVIHQLPQDLETLWFRLLGKGRVQSLAIAEVAALAHDHPGRQDALAWLGNLRVILEARESKEPEEEDLMMQLSPLFLEKLEAAEQRGETRGELKGRQEGKTEEGQALILRQLKRRLGDISIDSGVSGEINLEARVRALTLERLEELGEALLDFTDVEDLERFLDG